MKFVDEIDLKGKIALVRVNLNVPIENGRIKDDFRIRAVLPTIDYVRKNARKTVLMAHLGRPKGKVDKKLSLKPVADYFEDLYKEDFTFLNDCIGDQVKASIDTEADGTVILLENLRFHKGERANDESFGKALAELGDVFINDAFGDSYGEYASVVIPPTMMPSAAGFRIKEEIDALSRIKDNPDKPFVVIIGGVKIKEKMGVIKLLGEKADQVLIGGALANTMLAAQGVDVKDSLIQKEELDLALELLDTFSEKIVLPSDVVVTKKKAKTFDPASVRTVEIDELEDKDAILDIGGDTFEQFKEICESASTVFWAGPMGYIEWTPSAKHSVQLALLLGGLSNYTACGGGETAQVIKMAGVEDQMDFISTGGGAALKYLSGEELPGLKALG